MQAMLPVEQQSVPAHMSSSSGERSKCSCATQHRFVVCMQTIMLPCKPA